MGAQILIVDCAESELLRGQRLGLAEGEIAVIGRAIGCDVSTDRELRDRDLSDADSPLAVIAPYQVRITNLGDGRVRLEPMGGITRANGFPLDHDVVLALGMRPVDLELAGAVRVSLSHEASAPPPTALVAPRARRRHRTAGGPPLRRIGSWGTSALLHGALILLLAWLATSIPLDPDRLEPIQVEIVRLDRPVELPDPEMEIPRDEPLLDAAEAPGTVSTRAHDEAAATDRPRDEPLAAPAGERVGASAIGLGIGAHGTGLTGRIGRDGARRGSGARGPGRTSVDAALRWLAAHQMPDGTWTADDQLDACDCTEIGRPGPDYRAALTGLAVIAFLREGHTHRDGELRDTVRAALGALRRLQADDGSFARAGRRRDAGIYESAIAAWALCEMRARTGSSLLLVPTRRAVDFLVRSQIGYSGWRYARSDAAADTSVTGFAVLALEAATRAEIDVPPSAFVGARLWLDRVTDPTSGRVGYEKRGRGSPAMTATGTLIRLTCGASSLDADVVRARTILASAEPEWREDGKLGAPESNLYLWYFGAAAERAGAGLGARWSSGLRNLCQRHQETRGHATGSWPARGDLWARRGGRILSTVLAVLTIQETR